eukprot:4848207-Pyramimonas_sp.AAC.1
MDGFPRYEESVADLQAQIMEVRDERELLEAIPLENFFTVPAHVISDNSVLITVAEEQRGHLPKWRHPRYSDIEETHHVPLCPTVEDCSCGLDSYEIGHCVELCFAAEVSKVGFSEQRRRKFDAAGVTTMRVYFAAAAKRAAAVKEDDVLAKAG